ncbi:MAG: putative peptidoglycan binding domain, partial [Actinomycetota bacterium]
MLVSVLVFTPVANAQSAQSSQTGQNSQGPLSLQSSLKFGARGSAVVALQQALITRGVAVVGGADGIFGKATRKALKTFQSKNELIPDGQLNSTTAYLLGLGPIPTLPKRGQR